MNLAKAKVAQILIPVEDFDKGVAFYRDVLRIPPPTRPGWRSSPIQTATSWC